jgi:hypothetical protein
MAAISFSGRSGCPRRCRFGRLSGSFSGALSRACRSYSGWCLRLGPLPTPASLAPDAPPTRGLMFCPPKPRGSVGAALRPRWPPVVGNFLHQYVLFSD